MEKEDSLAKHKEEIRMAEENACARVASMNIPKEITIPKKILALGKKSRKLYEKTRAELELKHVDSLSRTMGAALHEYWFACWSGAEFIQACINDKSMLDNEFTRGLTSGQGYADYEGWAATIANGHAAIEPSEIRKKFIKELDGFELIDAETAHKCMALYWLNEADKEMQNGRLENACDLIHEAHQAFLMQTIDDVWNDAWTDATKHGGEISAGKARSDLAKAAANRAHEENRAMKKEVQDFWSCNIDPSLSNEGAARVLSRQFPLTVRTLSQYVADFKRTPC